RDVGGDGAGDIVESDRQSDRDGHAGVAEASGDAGRAGEDLDRGCVGGLQRDSVGGDPGRAVAVDVGLNVVDDVVLGVDAARADADAGVPTARHGHRGGE